MKPVLLPQLSELQTLRGAPMIVYSSMITDDTIRIIYECLRQIGPVPRLDLVLSTSGGVITAARRLALLLREFTQHLTILVPERARSAGTLLCLSAQELILGPMAELGPIDAHISSTGSSLPDAPGAIPTEDVRVFRQMAEDWFGINREKDRLQVLALIVQRVFPTSLSSLYRSDKLIRQSAYELLCYQLPNAEEHIRQQIVNQLVGGYHSHDHRSKTVAWLFLSGEIATAMLVSPGSGLLSIGFLLAIVMLTVFTIALVTALWRNINMSCSCFGRTERRISRYDVARNACLILCSLFGLGMLRYPLHGLSTGEMILLALMSLVFLLLSINLGDIVETLRRPFTVFEGRR